MDNVLGMKWDNDSKYIVFEHLKQIKFEKGEILFYSLKKIGTEKTILKISGIDEEQKEGFYVVLKYKENVKYYKYSDSQKQDLGNNYFSDTIIQHFTEFDEACIYFNNLRSMLLA